MDAKRLEALVSLCDAYAADHDAGIADYLNTADIAALARCAKAWAKYARLKGRLELDDSMAVYLFPKGGGTHDYTTADTAIAAVEAAPEVKP